MRSAGLALSTPSQRPKSFFLAGLCRGGLAHGRGRPRHRRVRYDASVRRMLLDTDITRMPCPGWRQCVTLSAKSCTARGRDLELVNGPRVCDWLGWKR